MCRIDDDFGTNSMPLNPGDDAESGAESETLGRRVEMLGRELTDSVKRVKYLSTVSLD